MTEDTMNLRGLLEKTADSDFLREMISFSAQRLMELEVESLTGAPRSPTSCAPSCRNLPPSWTKPRPMCWPTWTSRPLTGPSCIPPTRSND